MRKAKAIEARANVRVTVERDNTVDLIVIDFDAEEISAVDWSLIFDVEAVFYGKFECFHGVHIIADNENIVNVNGEKEDNGGGTTIVNTFVGIKNSETKRQDKCMDDIAPNGRGLFETVE